MSIRHDEQPSLPLKRTRQTARRLIANVPTTVRPTENRQTSNRPASPPTLQTGLQRATRTSSTEAPSKGRNRHRGHTARRRSFSLPVVSATAVFALLGGVFLGIALFPLFDQPRSLIPAIAGRAGMTVSASPPLEGTAPGTAAPFDQDLPEMIPAGTDGLVSIPFLQVGAFEVDENAQSVTFELLRLGMNVYLIPDDDLVKVQVGPFRTAEVRNAAARLLNALGYPVMEREWLAPLEDRAGLQTGVPEADLER